MPFKGLFNLMLVFGMFCFGLCFNTPGRLVAADWQLERLGQRWTIDDVTGAIHEASHTPSEADGFPVALSKKKIELKVLSKSYDVYELPTVQSALGSSERQDRVVEVVEEQLPEKLVLRCENEELGLQLIKTYFFEPEMGWFCKRLEIKAPDQQKGFIVVSAGMKFTTRMWRDAVLHHPGSHGSSVSSKLANEIDDELNLRSGDCTGMICLSNFKHDLTFTSVRLASNDQPAYWMFCPKFSGFPVPDEKGQLVDFQVPGVKRMWSVTMPGRWQMPYLYGPVGNGLQQSINATVAFPVTYGNYADFCAKYVGREWIRDMLQYESLDRPAWVQDIVVSDWEDYFVSPNRNNTLAGQSWKRVLDKMWFGYATVVNYGYFVPSWGYPGNEEEWSTHYITCSQAGQSLEDHRAWLQKSGKDPNDYIVSSDEKFYVIRNSFKPQEFIDSRQEILEAAEKHPRLKVGDYSHTGHTGFDRSAQFLKDHPDTIVYRRNGEVYANAADYSGDWYNPVGVHVHGGHPAVRSYWINRCAERIKNLEIDFYYIDSICVNTTYVDWKNHRVCEEEDLYALWRGLQDVCREAEIPIFHNNPFATFNDIGYSEHPWFSTWQTDWRIWSSRQIAHNAMNPKGRPLILIGDRDWHHYEAFRNAPSAPMRLFAPILWNARISFNNFAHGYPLDQASFTIESLPWIQAGYELRMRTYAQPDVRPRWWAYETELEAQPYQLGASGVIALMNHDDQKTHEITYQPSRFSGMKRERPTWVWRIDVPHPLEVDYDGVTETSPIRRLVRQTEAGFFEQLPERIDYQAEFPHKVPVVLLVTQVPGLIETVDGRSCQLLLPENYRAEVTGTCDLSNEKISLMIKSDHERATALVPMLPGKDQYRVSARSMSRFT